MKDSPLIQYGVAIDPAEMVKPPDPDELEVDPKTPGIDDEEYMTRRRWIFRLTRKHRLERLGPPVFEYTPERTQQLRAERGAKLLAVRKAMQS